MSFLSSSLFDLDNKNTIIRENKMPFDKIGLHEFEAYNVVVLFRRETMDSFLHYLRAYTVDCE